MKPVPSTQYKLIGYVILEHSLPTFILPVFNQAEQENSGYYVQNITTSSKLVSGFQSLSLNITELCTYKSNAKISLGDAAIFGLINTYKELFIGNHTELSPRVKKYMNDDEISSAKQIQLAEFCGDTQVLTNARTAFAQSIYKTVGEKGLKTYINSSIRLFAWSMLEEQAKSPALRNVLLKELSKLDFFIDSSGDVKFHNYSIEYTIDQDQLKHIKELIKKNYKTLINKVTTYKPDTKELFKQKTLEQIFLSAETFKRQESRLAFIIQAILERPHYANEIIDKYVDKAAATTRSLIVIKNEFAQREAFIDRKHIETKLAKCIISIHRSWYPMAKTMLLFEFSLRLGGYPIISKTIIRLASRKRQGGNYLSEIINNLSHRRGFSSDLYEDTQESVHQLKINFE